MLNWVCTGGLAYPGCKYTRNRQRNPLSQTPLGVDLLCLIAASRCGARPDTLPDLTGSRYGGIVAPHCAVDGRVPDKTELPQDRKSTIACI
jgi:hypothetical protein